MLERPLHTDRLTLRPATPTTPTRPGRSAGSSPSTSGSPGTRPISTATATCSPTRPASPPPSSSARPRARRHRRRRPHAPPRGRLGPARRRRSGRPGCAGRARLGARPGPLRVTGTRPRRSRELLRHCFTDLGVRRVRRELLPRQRRRRGASWSGSACAARCTPSATRCTVGGAGSTRHLRRARRRVATGLTARSIERPTPSSSPPLERPMSTPHLRHARRAVPAPSPRHAGRLPADGRRTRPGEVAAAPRRPRLCRSTRASPAACSPPCRFSPSSGCAIPPPFCRCCCSSPPGSCSGSRWSRCPASSRRARRRHPDCGQLLAGRRHPRRHPVAPRLAPLRPRRRRSVALTGGADASRPSRRRYRRRSDVHRDPRSAGEAPPR